VSYDIHPGGHEMDTRAALQFLSASGQPRSLVRGIRSNQPTSERNHTE